MKLRLLLLCFLTIGWLVPFTWVGSTLGRLPFRVPSRLWQQYNAAALFTKRTGTWPERGIQVRTADTGQWQPLDMRVVSPMPTSGYRQRLDRILGDLHNKKIAESFRRRLAGWLAQEVKGQTGQELTGVRFLQRTWRVNTPEMAFPAGAWQRDRTAPTPTMRETILGTYAIVNGAASPAPPQPPPPRPLPTPRIFRRSTPAQVSSQ